jgi:hypothetical protein
VSGVRKTVAGVASALLTIAATLLLMTTPASAAGPCYNVVAQNGDTETIQVWYACNSTQVKSTRVWLTKTPPAMPEAGHFQLRNGAGTYANSPATYSRKVGQQWVVNHTWNSHHGELVCADYWTTALNQPVREFGKATCVTT